MCVRIFHSLSFQSGQSGITTRTAWLGWVTKIIHGSLDPMTGKPKETGDHFFKYEVWGGSPAHTTEDGVAFSLDKWLEKWAKGEAASANSDPTKHKSQFIHTVNCFD